MGAFSLLSLLTLTAGVISMAVLRRRAQRRNDRTPERKDESQEMNSATEVGGTTEQEEGTKVHTYSFVFEGSSTEGRSAMYQGLDVGTQDYVRVYTQLGGGTYQELDPQGRKVEHHYHTADAGQK